MELYEKVNSIKSKDDLLDFIELLVNNFKNNPEEWENRNLDDYLNAMKSWINDMEGYYNNMNRPIPSNINWNFIATILIVAKMYE